MIETKVASMLMRAWQKRGWFACLMWPLSALFGMVLKLRVFLYRAGWLQQRSLAVPVIVVGNIFVGGTGKTPLALWLVNKLRQAGYHPGVISRGYGGKHAAPCVVTASSLTDEVGDEPVLLAQRGACPVVVGRNRVMAGNWLLSHFPEVNVIISDDGLQHLPLARDVEIILFDSRGTGNGWLLPAGPLREPVGRRADITVINLNEGESIHRDLPIDSFRMELKGTCARRLTDISQVQDLSAIDPGLKVLAAAGIGNPERFFTLLHRQGLFCAVLPLPDHFNYAINPFDDIVADMILITEKDAVKCRQQKDIANDSRIWVVEVEADLEVGAFEKIKNSLIN